MLLLSEPILASICDARPMTLDVAAQLADVPGVAAPVPVGLIAGLAIFGRHFFALAVVHQHVPPREVRVEIGRDRSPPRDLVDRLDLFK